MDWELGQKADPLAPAPPGIKPEWYFLWIYQLLREFPAHVGPLEGPQAALLLVAGLLGTWVAVPWLDRRARRGRPSPGSTDFGVAALLFLGWLTLEAWDIGGGGGEKPDHAAVARTVAWYVLGISAAVTLLRAWVLQQRWFLFTGMVTLQAVLHGLAGWSFLLAGGVAVLVGILAGATLALVRRRGGRASEEGT
ncbi:MAG: hypothetical protein ACQEXJ_24065 [Myxococcota bacterium]